MLVRILTFALCLAVSGWALGPALAAKELRRDLSKEFEELTPSEKIAIRAAAKVAYKAKKLQTLKVCADPGNMPFSNDKFEGLENKIANVLGEATGARVSFYWRPFLERAMTRQTFDAGMCDVMIDIPANYGSLLTTNPIYRTTYVLAFRDDKGIDIKSLDDPKLKELKIGVFQTSGIRDVLAKHGIINNVSLHVVTHDADLNPENQPWYQVQQVVDGDLDVAAVWGPFAGWVKSKGAPLTILPVNLMEDKIPLEFDLAIGVRKTDAFLKYMLEFALEDKQQEIAKILKDYGVPLVQCSRCLVSGDLPSHGSYTEVTQEDFKARPDLASPDQVVTKEKVEGWLADGADITQELSNALIANDLDRVKFLVGKGADVNQPDNQGWTPLISAARQRHDDMINLLIELGADVNLAKSDGTTPLIAAASRDHVPSIKVLLEHGADIEKPGPQGFRALPLAIADDNYEAAKALIEAGAKVNEPSGAEGLTPLMVAAAQTAPAEGAMFLPSSTRPIDIAKSLIERGANVNAQSTKGVTALMIAATHNNPPMIGLLMESGADASLKDDQGQTATDVATRNGNIESAQAIMVLGAAKAAESEPSPAPEKGQGTSSQ
ncbi:MAG TPA: quinoprotein dehydrogenase-associated putative ABC transporter substrate-binding protein [Rhizobiales bacterium]|jgi:quinoprotein dehydrogenase-associated probable ABC transporter substrate-binding protein|nr:quinoprotein dehydrogenase-associated putative ABC transporter substrate-binding protein [Hyphomicrobiales bacterium]HBH41780.1 quinoprotein dehydrogenase-associated putative ABC transporter substrate-binding protein [Hyphomicrobiales bacterium]HCL62309.1 quinoprotein dehydrogenase-associated putative ABC transporter substrate-binding protein [Hyphomicrobiales bacterium]